MFFIVAASIAIEAVLGPYHYAADAILAILLAFASFLLTSAWLG